VLTAGDGGSIGANWVQRELGLKAAYAQMVGVANSWTRTDAGLTRPAVLDTLNGAPRVSIVFLRLPDGMPDGTGTPAGGFTSLKKLWQSTISSISALDGSASYSRADLIGTLRQLMIATAPDRITTQNFGDGFDDGDHSDHHAAAYFTKAASELYPGPHWLIAYYAYGVVGSPANVDGQALADKTAAYYTYAAFDPDACKNDTECAGTIFAEWLARQYTGDEIDRDGSATNQAPSVTISSPTSSETYQVGSQLSLAGSATDPEDGSVPSSALSWTVRLLGCLTPELGSCTVGPQSSFTGATASFTVPQWNGPGSQRIQIILSASDVDGTTAQSTVTLLPVTGTLEVTSDPAGAPVSIDGETVTAPATVTRVAGSSVTVSAPSSATIGGVAHMFASWSDGGDRTHDVTVTSSAQTLQANFTPAPVPPPPTSAAGTGLSPETIAAILAYVKAAEDAKVRTTLATLARIIAARKAAAARAARAKAARRPARKAVRTSTRKAVRKRATRTTRTTTRR
jgi:LmbE family N-acetylglucosaminyl deacetylase